MINQMLAELRMIESRTRRQWEDEAAERANNRDYNLSQESKDALERGDKQRRTGVYQTEHDHDCIDREDETCIKRGFCVCTCGAIRQVLSIDEPLEQNDFGGWLQ